MARRFGLSPGIAVDLRTGWDLDDPEDIKKLWGYLVQERPLLVVGSPECKAFGNLWNLNPKSEKYHDILRTGIRHMKLMMDIYEWQVS